MKGMVISTVGWLILAIVCLVVLIIFFSKLVPAVGGLMDAVVLGIKQKICDMIPRWNIILRAWLGCKII